MSHKVLSRPVIAACFMQFDVAFSMNFALGFLTLFINIDLGFSNLAEAALWAGTIQFASSTAMAVGQPVWGWLSDRIGGTKMLMRIIVVNTCGLTILTFATDVYQVLLINLVVGMLGGTSTVIMTVIASVVREEDLAQAMGYQQVAQTTGFLLGPALGAIVAMMLGFRTCFLIGGIIIGSSIILLRWARFPRIERTAKSHEKIDWRSLKGLWRDFLALVSIQAAYQYLSPILPLYLTETGLSGNLLVGYTGLVLSLSSLAYAVSVPITSRLFERRHFAIVSTVCSGIIFLQGLFRDVFGFICMRLVQCVIQSGGPTMLFGSAGGKKRDKGLSIGILNSGRFLGNALGPLVASSVAFATNLTTSFAIIAFISFLGTIWAISERAEKNPTERA